MDLPFLYDTHYQLDRPLELIHLTSCALSATRACGDEAAARRLVEVSRRKAVDTQERTEWKTNVDQMLYWVQLAKQGELLSNQNAFGYWLLNFVLTNSFDATGPVWGAPNSDSELSPSQLLWRWAWLQDGAMLAAFLSKIAIGGLNRVSALLDRNERHVEETLISVLRVVRESASDAGTQADL